MIYRNRWEIHLSKHALLRAKQRGILPDMISSTIKFGRIEKFGKNMIKFISDYKIGKIICVGEKKGENVIKILTVEWG